jgi:hypothetical protein
LKPIYIFNRENPQNSEPQNGPRRGLGFIALAKPKPDHHKPPETQKEDKSHYENSITERASLSVRNCKKNVDF